MTNEEFQTILKTEVDSLAGEFSTEGSRAFLLWLAHSLLLVDSDDAFEAAKIDGANDKGIDLFWIDEDHERIFIIQGKYSPNGKSRASERDLEALLGSTEWLESPEQLRRDGRPELAEAAEQYLEACRKGYSTQLWFAYCGPNSTNLDKRATAFTSSKKNRDRHHTCHIFSIERIREQFEEATGPRRRVATASLGLDPSHAFEQAGVYGNALVATVSGKSLAELYSQHGDRLFDRNVRLFLGTKKGSVNAGIFETLTDDHERQLFWAYNNGITVVCDSFKVDREKGTVRLDNFSIVNGCQTTVSLAKNIDTLTDKVQVLVKVVSPPEQVIDPIIRFTNSQNQIKVWDIFTQDRTQRRLQKAFSSLNRPYLYLLRKGELPSLSADQKKRYRDDGRIRTIKHDVLAQYLAAFRGNPWAAYREKSLLFSKYYDDIYPSDLRVEEALFAWLAGELTTAAVHQAIREAVLQKREERVRVLKRGGRLFALGALGLIAELRNSADYRRSITEERIASKRASERLGKYVKLATLWYADAARDLIEQTNTEVSILVRSRDYFQKISDRIRSLYETATVNEQWLKGAMPLLF